MTAFCKTYEREDRARHAVDALLRAGVLERDVTLMTGSRRRDVRRELVGGFAGATGPGAEVGTFAGIPVVRRQGVGSFAGDPDRRRQGSFADSDRVVIRAHGDRARRPRVVGQAAVRRLLRESSLADDAQRVIDMLAMGQTVLVVETSDIRPSDARAQLENLRHAA